MICCLFLGQPGIVNLTIDVCALPPPRGRTFGSWGGKVKIAKRDYRIPVDLEGVPYGTTLAVNLKKRVLQRQENPEDQHAEVIADSKYSADHVISKDNATIYDRGVANQKLDHLKIAKLKNKGASGAEIINQLIDNSKSFHRKLGFLLPSFQLFIRMTMQVSHRHQTPHRRQDRVFSAKVS